ncbi:MAG: hypothetical protein Q9168_008206 [Polycauliona sp. 1 TL-2023]
MFPPYAKTAGINAAIEAHYPPTTAPNTNYTTARARARDLLNEASFVCNTRYLSDAYTGHNYNLQYSVTPGFHATDLLPTFYNLNLDLDALKKAISIPLIPIFGGFSQAYQSYLTSFARTGDPNVFKKTVGVPPAVGWPKAVNSGDKDMIGGVLEAGDLGFSVIDDGMTRRSRCNFWRDVQAAVTAVGVHVSSHIQRTDFISVLHLPPLTHSKAVMDDHEDVLFRDTSHRWLWNESARKAERYLEFNVLALKTAAARAMNRAEYEVVIIRKHGEDSSKRTFTLTWLNGYELLAEMPLPEMVTKRYTTASAVATMDYIRHFGVPVPIVHDYCTTSDNLVGAEYIIMEKLGGKHQWPYWNIPDRRRKHRIMMEVVKLQATLFSIVFPASGSIYYRRDLENEDFGMTIWDPPGNGDQDFCIGPDADRRWWYKERAKATFVRAPYMTAQEVMSAVAQRELAWTSKYAQPRLPSDIVLKQDSNYHRVRPDDYTTMLKSYLQVSDWLVPKDGELEYNRFILHHRDLQPDDLLFSDEGQLLGVINWQRSSILPMFLHCGIPSYFRVCDDEDFNERTCPQKPKNDHLLNELERKAAFDRFHRREIHFLYVHLTDEFNSDFAAARNAADISLRQQVYRTADRFWEGNNVDLAMQLLYVQDRWESLVTTSDGDGGTASKCPFYVPITASKKTRRLFRKVEANMKTSIEERRRLGIMDHEGAVCPQDYQQVKQRYHDHRARCLKKKGAYARRVIEDRLPLEDLGSS